MGEDLECLCQIMRTVGPRLDHEKAKVKKKTKSAEFYSKAAWATLLWFSLFRPCNCIYFSLSQSL